MAFGIKGLFGDLWKKDSSEDISKTNQIEIPNDEGSFKISDPMSNYLINFDFVADTQAELINTYREVANYAEVDLAIEDIINETVSFTEDEDPIKIDLSDIEGVSEATKKKMVDGFEKVCRLMNLEDTIYNKMKKFYVDGRMAYQKVVNTHSLKKGLVNIVELDPIYVKAFKAIKTNESDKTIDSVEEFYLYDENILNKKTETGTDKNPRTKTAVRMSPDALAYVTTGLTDPKTGFAISWLHKAIKPANQLRMMENALVIYRISRAPERRIFYVHTGNMPKSKGEQYLMNLKNSYRNKMSYDPESGSFKDNRHLMTMQEDYWLPRNESGKGTEVSTLPGGQNLGDIEDVLYFMKKLYKSLNIPVSRLDQSSAIIGGRSSEIDRDELKFSKFVSKIRKRFNVLLKDLLKTELILTGVINERDWAEIESKIRFIYAQDMYLEERKFFEMTRDRIELVKDLEDNGMVGKYYSHKTIREKFLRQTDEEIKAEDKEISAEAKNKQFQDNEGDENE